ncbi:hypothetical protein [Solitalea lacus]|uniref:hypothetical protein n=1 Tax=Solitalea lacus TaxID=2911172 RepID=UPI001EDC7A6B|nr:hypothetical protein [Solitalea lacus]UKJ07786.1 hypothetical protein L2B55_01150 [Solitalea lacus]
MKKFQRLLLMALTPFIILNCSSLVASSQSIPFEKLHNLLDSWKSKTPQKIDKELFIITPKWKRSSTDLQMDEDYYFYLWELTKSKIGEQALNASYSDWEDGRYEYKLIYGFTSKLLKDLYLKKILALKPKQIGSSPQWEKKNRCKIYVHENVQYTIFEHYSTSNDLSPMAYSVELRIVEE